MFDNGTRICTDLIKNLGLETKETLDALDCYYIFVLYFFLFDEYIFFF